jgi:hypothetical protein
MNNVAYPIDDFCLRTPFSIFVVASSSCGKTLLTVDIVKNWNRATEGNRLAKCILFYRTEQPLYNTLETILRENDSTFIKYPYDQLPSIEELRNPDFWKCDEGEILIILDDCLSGLTVPGFENVVIDLFQQHRHHSNANIIINIQNFKEKNKSLKREILANATHVAILPCPFIKTDLVLYLQRNFYGQMFPRFLQTAVDKAFNSMGLTYLIFNQVGKKYYCFLEIFFCNKKRFQTPRCNIKYRLSTGITDSDETRRIIFAPGEVISL